MSIVHLLYLLLLTTATLRLADCKHTSTSSDATAFTPPRRAPFQTYVCNSVFSKYDKQVATMKTLYDKKIKDLKDELALEKTQREEDLKQFKEQVEELNNQITKHKNSSIELNQQLISTQEQFAVQIRGMEDQLHFQKNVFIWIENVSVLVFICILARVAHAQRKVGEGGYRTVGVCNNGQRQEDSEVGDESAKNHKKEILPISNSMIACHDEKGLAEATSKAVTARIENVVKETTSGAYTQPDSGDNFDIESLNNDKEKQTSIDFATSLITAYNHSRNVGSTTISASEDGFVKEVLPHSNIRDKEVEEEDEALADEEEKQEMKSASSSVTLQEQKNEIDADNEDNYVPACGSDNSVARDPRPETEDNKEDFEVPDADFDFVQNEEFEVVMEKNFKSVVHALLSGKNSPIDREDSVSQKE